MTKLLTMAAGGTGGHMFPAQALAEAMLHRGWRVQLTTDVRGARYVGGFPHTVEIIELPSATFARGGIAAKAMDIMRTITRVETGHTRDGEFRPWPWTVNHDGDGSWHDTRREASQFLRALRQSGYRNFDIGCFQLNFRWHGEHFDSTGDMLDPRKNADYAARFLRQLLQEEGNWTAAVAAYHSRTKHFAERYAARFDAIRRDLDADRPADQTKPDRSPPASNGGVIPLLAVGSAARPLFLIGGTD